MKRVAALLITVTLIAGLAGCPAEPEPSPPVQHSLTISSSGGGEMTTPGEGVHVYSRGEVVSLVATPASGHYFGGWTGDVGTIANTRAASTTITMSGDYSITANFQVIPVAKYNLTVSSTEGGSVTAPGEGTFTYDAGTVVDLVAEAEEGRQFTYWTGNVGTIGDVNASSTTVAMTGHYTITANFATEIRNWYDLDAIRDNLSGHYVLVNDLDSATHGYSELAGPSANGGKGWQPIGALLSHHLTTDITEAVDPFTGRFDGQTYEIRDLFVKRSDGTGVGLFGLVGEGGFVRNLAMMNAHVTGGLRVGAVVGENRGTVSNCYAIGSVNGDRWVGGLVGVNGPQTLSNSYYSGSVVGSWQVGGLVGFNHGIVSNSYHDYDDVLVNGHKVISIGTLFSEEFEQWLAGDQYLGVNERLSQEDGYYLINDVNDFKSLLAFCQDGALRFRLTNDIDLAAEPDLYIPYLAGEFDGSGYSVLNLSFGFDFVSQVGLFGYVRPEGEVTQVNVENIQISGDGYVGSLAGWNSGTVSNCYSTGVVGGGWGVGGLVGALGGGIVSRCHTTASVDANWGVGGLVGDNFHGAVSDSYSTGNVNGEGSIGGLIGYNFGTVTNSHYDYESVQINGRSIITIGALFGEDFEQWLANGRFLDVNERLAQEDGCYVIGNLTDLKQLLAFGQDGALRFRLTNDVDLGDAPDFYIPYLAGEFDGHHHRILNLCVNYDFVANLGLFGYLGPNGRISAVGVENVTIAGHRLVGGLVGANWRGTISNAYASGTVSGLWQVGGLVGWNDGSVRRSYFDGGVAGEYQVGALVGDNWGPIDNSCSAGSVTGAGWVGGLVGRNSGALSSCYSIGSVTGNHYAGGLVGLSDGSVSNSFWDTQTSGQATSDGGTGKTTSEMKSIATFSGAGWSIIAVASAEARNTSRIWNIVEGETYPFLSWRSVS